jgi:Base plate wedge protein 53
MSFFRQFPTTQYDVLRNGSLTTIVDLFRNVTAKSKIKLDPNLAYTYYDVQNGDRPDVVSQKLYGDSDYYWTFFIINDFLKRGLNEWPKSQKEMEDYLTREYDQYSVIQMSDTSSGLDSQTSTYSTNVNGIDFLNNQYYVKDLNNTISLKVMKYDPSMQQLWVYNPNGISISKLSTFQLTT